MINMFKQGTHREHNKNDTEQKEKISIHVSKHNVMKHCLFN